MEKVILVYLENTCTKRVRKSEGRDTCISLIAKSSSNLYNFTVDKTQDCLLSRRAKLVGRHICV